MIIVTSPARFRECLISALAVCAVVFLFVGMSEACGGKDVILTGDSSLIHQDGRYRVEDDDGDLLIHESEIYISPERARSIAEKFVTDHVKNPPLPLTFRKFEYVHGKIIYQFESGPLENYDGKYHLGPVNFRVEGLMLDVDAVTGDLYLAAGCGSAPGKLLYRYDPEDFAAASAAGPEAFVSNNTNFIARKTGNRINIDGRISDEEWKNTGHRYFYLGTYKDHNPDVPHDKPFYYAEVLAQIDNNTIYFAVKTDTPFWVGLMFKNDANLGMLWAYKDAKVMKSDGEVSDRYFSKRPDGTYYLERDGSDHVLARGHRQNDLYTYEFSFPLETGDEQDVSFELGKAYNMLLVIGNTQDHYGIFTLDDAHKNHDHSKNNKEHADVWASNETIFRIGDAADKDIYGHTVVPALTGFESGYDPSKSGIHFHYLDTHLKDFAGRASLTGPFSWLTVILGLIGVGIIMSLLIRSSSHQPRPQYSDGLDLMKISWLRPVITSKYFRYAFIIPTLVIFLAVMYLGLADVQDGRRNIATVFTWTLWWSLIIFSLIIMGRFWCMMCPFAFIGDLFQKVISLNKKLPRPLQNMGLQIVGFLVLTWAFTVMAFGSSPFVTSVVIAVILAAAVILSIIYERRTFCRHICPIGAVIGIYSMISPIELRSCSPGRCGSHKRKTCHEACPMLESPEHMDNNVYCNFCMKCQPACPTQNLSLRLRAFGKDIYASLRKSPAEAAAALLLLGVVIVETLAMTASWAPLKNSFSALTGISAPPLVYTIVFSLVIMIPVGIFYLVCYLLKLWLGKNEYRTRDIVKDFAFLFIPLGVGLHFAHNIQHLLIESPIAVPAVIRFFQNAGIGTSLPVNWNPSPLMGLQPIFFIQMSILITGFGFTLYVMYRLFRRYHKPLYHTYKMILAMSLYAVIIVLSGIYMLGLPMSGRHVH